MCLTFHTRVVHFFGMLKVKVFAQNIHGYFHKKSFSQAYLIWVPQLDVFKTVIPIQMDLK